MLPLEQEHYLIGDKNICLSPGIERRVKVESMQLLIQSFERLLPTVHLKYIQLFERLLPTIHLKYSAVRTARVIYSKKKYSAVRTAATGRSNKSSPVRNVEKKNYILI